MKNGGNATDEELELGSYFHFADNLHFYERHYKLADEIINEDTYNKYRLKLKFPFFIKNKSKIEMTDFATSFLDNVKKCIDLNVKDEKYKEVIEEYFTI
jgi:thymidylate synthase